MRTLPGALVYICTVSIVLFIVFWKPISSFHTAADVALHNILLTLHRLVIRDTSLVFIRVIIHLIPSFVIIFPAFAYRWFLKCALFKFEFLWYFNYFFNNYLYIKLFLKWHTKTHILKRRK